MRRRPDRRFCQGLWALLILAGVPAFAQNYTYPVNYSWRNSSAAYSPILGNEVDFPSPARAFAVVDLPFHFKIDGHPTASIRISRYGYLAVSDYRRDSATAVNADLFLPYGGQECIIAPWWDDLTDDSLGTVQWLASGVAPNRVFTIQFADYPDFRTAPNARLNFQVKLFETSNRIQLLYGPRNGTPNPASSASLGLRGNTARTLPFLEGTTGSRLTARPALNSGTDFPAPNTVYTFDPDSVAPAVLKTISGDGKIALSWNRSRSPSISGYRIYKGDSPSALALYDSTLSRTDTSLSIGGLANLRAYYFAVSAVVQGGQETGFFEVIAAMPSQAPTITLTAPLDGVIARTDSGISLTAETTDLDGTVAKVEYFEGKNYIAGVPNFRTPWPAYWFPKVPGTYTVTAKATDNTGAVGVSNSVTIQVLQTPTVTISDPPERRLPPGSSVSFTATVANLPPGESAARVEFFDFSTKIGEDLSPPYTFDLAKPKSGEYIISAYVVDAKGHRTQSNLSGIIIADTPSAIITRPAQGAILRFPGPVSVTAEVTDPDSTLAYMFIWDQKGGETVGTLRPPAPYALTWTPKAPGPKFLVPDLYESLGWHFKQDTVKILLLEHPEVKLTSPAHFSAYAGSSAIPLSAEVIAVDGSSPKVLYYCDSVLLGEAAAAPFTFTWTDPPSGRWRVQARVVDNTGDTGYSQAATVFVNDSVQAGRGGRILVTGHDPIEHESVDFLSAGLDFLLFGRAAKPYERPFRKGARLAHLCTSPLAKPIRDYPAATQFRLWEPDWAEKLFREKRFDAILVHLGPEIDSASTQALASQEKILAALIAQREGFEKYLNGGGGILITTDHGIGQSYYGFLPPFGSPRETSFPEFRRRTTITAAGASIGLTATLVDRDLYHTEYHDVDRSFLPLEIPDGDGAAITLGAHVEIAGGKFLPLDPAVADPEATARDTVFRDSLCVAFSTPTAGAILHLTRDGGNPDTSSWTLPNGGVKCVDRSTTFRVIAKKAGWISSAEKRFSFRDLNQVIPPLPDIVSPYFEDSVCVRFTSATAGASFVYALSGHGLDTSGMRKSNGDSVCLYASDTIRVMGLKPGMRNSDSAAYAYSKRTAPTVDPVVSSAGDSAVFKRRLCFSLATRTDGARIAYALDGKDPLASGLSMESGDSLCLERSAVVVAVGVKPEWKNSVPARFIYIAEDEKLAILKAEIRPFGLREVSVGGNCLPIGQDTLVLTLSDRIKPASSSPRWDRLAVFSDRCDSNATTPIPLREPVVLGDGLVLSFLLDKNPFQAMPGTGGCVYLESGSGEFTDVVGKPPSSTGVNIEGLRKVTSVSLVRAYPPVAGLESSRAREICLDESGGKNTWIPPSGFDPGTGLVDNRAAHACAGNESENGVQAVPIPPCLSLLEVISDGGYVADFMIFDNLGTPVFASRQSFGACGKPNGPDRSVAGQHRSYLVWNGRDSRGARVGTGAYIWRILFSTDPDGNARSQRVFVRTGYLRASGCAD